MGKTSCFHERVLMVEQYKGGKRQAEIAKEMGYSKSTVNKWCIRGRSGDHSQLSSVMGRPPKGALSSYPSSLGEQLLAWRSGHPGWGASTLLAELNDDPYWGKESLPSVSSIKRFLKEQGLTRRYRRHTQLPQSPYEEINEPHQRWELDGRGEEYVADVGIISLVHINDCVSRTKLLSYPSYLGKTRLERRANTDDYQAMLRLSFIDWGLPDSLKVDHASVFYDNDSASPFPTRFHLWLISLGIDVIFGRKGTPTDQAITERSHQTWYKQVLDGQVFQNWETLYWQLQKRRDFLNNNLPCHSIGDLPPLIAYPTAGRPRRVYSPQREEQIIDMNRVYQYLATGRWFRIVSSNGTVSISGNAYYMGRPWIGQQIELVFDAHQKLMIAQSENGQETKSFQLKDINKKALIGTTGALYKLNGYQYELPFSYEAQKVSTTFRAFSVKT